MERTKDIITVTATILGIAGAIVTAYFTLTQRVALLENKMQTINENLTEIKADVKTIKQGQLLNERNTGK